jgi:hypothetical protein
VINWQWLPAEHLNGMLQSLWKLTNLLICSCFVPSCYRFPSSRFRSHLRNGSDTHLSIESPPQPLSSLLLSSYKTAYNVIWERAHEITYGISSGLVRGRRIKFPKETAGAHSGASAQYCLRFRAAGDLGDLGHGEDLASLELHEPVKSCCHCPTPALDWSRRLTYQWSTWPSVSMPHLPRIGSMPSAARHPAGPYASASPVGSERWGDRDVLARWFRNDYPCFWGMKKRERKENRER